MVVIESHHLVNHPRQGNIREKMLSFAFIVETSTNVTVVSCKPHFLDVGIVVVFLEEEERRFEFQASLVD